MNTRSLVVYLALTLTLGATVWSSSQEDDVTVAPRPPSLAARPPAQAGQAPFTSPVPAAARPFELVLPQPRQPFAAAGAGFAAPLSFRPQTPRSAPMAAPRPVAPPLPFRFVGAIEASAGRRVFLMDGAQLHVVVQGDHIDGRYRVDKVDDSRIEFTYLPLKQRQTLMLSNS